MSTYSKAFSTRQPWCPIAIIFLLIGSLTPSVSGQLLQNRFAQRFRAALPNRAQPVTSKNFTVYANDAVLAQKVSREAERYRKELAVEWIGKELPAWPERCPIQVQIGPDAGGETSFAFVFDAAGRGQPIDWQMKIFGPPDRLLDAVLPHEITHTIFATHFGRPLPRWADEGACTTVEHIAERTKNHQMLIRFLSAKPSRGIPFNRMFTMKDYPRDILPLYAQGYSLAKFLIFQRQRRHFLDYIAQGMDYESKMPALEAWDLATQEYYQFEDLSELQLAWQAWVKQGSKKDEIARFSKLNLDRVAQAQSPTPRQRRLVEPRVAPDRPLATAPMGTLARLEAPQGSRFIESAPRRGWSGKPDDSTISPQTLALAQPKNASESQASWYASQMRPGTTAQAVSFQKSRKAVGTSRIVPEVGPAPRKGEGSNRDNATLDRKDQTRFKLEGAKPSDNRVRSLIRIPDLEELKSQSKPTPAVTSRTLLR